MPSYCYLHTRQSTCHADDGREVPCEDFGQDTSFTVGKSWPEPRFDLRGSVWRLPAINEMEVLVDYAAHSPFGHPFTSVQNIYWSSTTSLFEPDWAWALYLEKGSTGVGQKRLAQFSVWAVTALEHET